MNVEIDGKKILSEKDFHRELSNAMSLSKYYGANLDALWDTLSVNVDRPVRLTWNHSRNSENAMAQKFAAIVQLLREIEAEDQAKGWTERFVLALT